MKASRFLLLLAALPMFFSACSSDEKEEVMEGVLFEKNDFGEIRMDDAGGTIVILKKTGNLNKLISSANKRNYERLALRGNLNGTDMLTLRELCGVNYTGDPLQCYVETLDLSKASIVKGGDVYYTTGKNFYTTSSGIVSNYLLSGCGIKKIVLPEGTTAVGEGALSGCQFLTEVSMSDKVESFGSNAFANCPLLSKIYLSANLSSIGSYCFANCTSLKSLRLPKSVKTIPEYAFTLCGLTDFHTGEGVTDIRKGAFSNCESLTTLTLERNVAFLNDRAFYNCTGLRRIIAMPHTPPEISEGAFENVDKSLVTVQTSSKTIAETYSTNTLWGRFGEVVYP